MIIERNIPLFRKIRFTHEPIPKKVLEQGNDIAIITYDNLDLPRFRSVERYTPIVELTKPLEDLILACNDTTRNEIRKAEKNPDIRIDICAYGDQRFIEAYEVFRNHESAQGRKPYPIESFSGYWFIVASYLDEVISCVSFLALSDLLRIRSISSKRLQTDDKEKKKIVSNSSRYVIWKLIEFGHEAGYSKLDMAYVSGGASEKLGIDAFKMGFGGEVVSDYTFSYRSPWIKLALQLVVAARNWRTQAKSEVVASDK